MTREEALNKAINIVAYFEAHFAKSKEAREEAANIIEALEQEPKTDTLDRIKAEMHENAEKHEDGDWYLREEWVDEIIDKYKAEMQ